MKLINLMPMLIKIVELGFSWPLSNSGLYWVALGLYPLQEQLMIFTLIPHQDSIQNFYILIFLIDQDFKFSHKALYLGY